MSALTPELLDAFPDEREALRGLAYMTDKLVSNLLGPVGRDLGWKNELSVLMVCELADKFLPLARLRLGLEDS